MGNSDSKWVKDGEDSIKVGSVAGGLTAAAVTVICFIFLSSSSNKTNDDPNKKET
jgi:hypothetical protein